MTPKIIYQQKIDAKEIRFDAQQSVVINKLDEIFNALIEAHQEKKRWLNKWRKEKSVKGLYLWGTVGIGKTFMMDCFYEALPIKKMRTHFHRFMREIHDNLTKIQGEKNPLRYIAKQIAKKTTVLCFDEFLVTNIADAMILSELLQGLFEEGITLITSSNTAPDLLYKDGLQRERFLPAIALIKAHTEVIHLHTHTDYRKQHIQQAGVYYTPINDHTQKLMNNCFIHFSYGAASDRDPIEILNRKIMIEKKAGSVIWFDFDAICEKPRSQLDYLEIIKQYHTILVSNLRHIKSSEKGLIRSFIHLVDILYDAHCRLIISANIDIKEIYTEGDAIEPYQRTYSRLVEMQSEDYVYPGSSSVHLTSL